MIQNGSFAASAGVLVLALINTMEATAAVQTCLTEHDVILREVPGWWVRGSPM